MKLAILGGTFDPVHIGHLHLAEEVHSQLNCPTILFVPSYISAHKRRGEWKMAEHRLRMLEIALEDSPWAKVDACEIAREGVSYSIETVAEIRKKYGLKEPPGFIIGEDLLNGFFSWKNADDLIDAADIIIARREPEFARNISFPHKRVDNLFLPLSSTDIRKRIKDGKPFRYLVSEKVYRYIKQHDLYQ